MIRGQWHTELREADLRKESYDVVLAAAVLHHLRGDEDWRAAFEKVISVLRPGGSFWITDRVVQETKPVQELMWARYGDYLEGLGGAEYRNKGFGYIDREDSPRPVAYPLDLLRQVGFSHVDRVHGVLDRYVFETHGDRGDFVRLLIRRELAKADATINGPRTDAPQRTLRRSLSHGIL